jgi:ferritin-like metal-binding protein YciE
MNTQHLKEMLLEALEHEQCGIDVYQAALQCVRNDDLKQEFRKYLKQTQTHVQVLTDICIRMDVAPDTKTQGREIVRMMGDSLVQAMRKAGQAGKPEQAEIVACECVALAEMKDHLNWELIGQAARGGTGEQMQALQEAYDEVEDQEDEHFYHSRGWARELHLQALGLDAVLPPPEEKRHAKSAVEAARAQKSVGH